MYASTYIRNVSGCFIFRSMSNWYLHVSMSRGLLKITHNGHNNMHVSGGSWVFQYIHDTHSGMSGGSRDYLDSPMTY